MAIGGLSFLQNWHCWLMDLRRVKTMHANVGKIQRNEAGLLIEAKFYYETAEWTPAATVCNGEANASASKQNFRVTRDLSLPKKFKRRHFECVQKSLV